MHKLQLVAHVDGHERGQQLLVLQGVFADQHLDAAVGQRDRDVFRGGHRPLLVRAHKVGQLQRGLQRVEDGDLRAIAEREGRRGARADRSSS